MKKLIIPSALALCAVSVQAQTVLDIDSFNQASLGNLNGSIDIAAGTIDQTIPDGTAQNGTDNVVLMTYTGLTLDGIGSADDSISLSILVTGTDYDADGTTLSSNQTIRDGGGGGRIAIGSTNARVLDLNDTMIFDISITDVSLGGVTDLGWTDNSSVVFDVVRLGGVQGRLTEATVNTVAFDNSVGLAAFDTTLSSNIATIVRTDNGGDAAYNEGRFRVDTLDFTITAVPEPSSYALLAGMLGLGYVMVRRRK